MSVDTRDKRMSMLGLTSPIRRLFQNPTGTIAAAARAMLLFLYRGILPDAPVAAQPRTATFVTWNVADTFLTWNVASTITSWNVADTFITKDTY